MWLHGVYVRFLVIKTFATSEVLKINIPHYISSIVAPMPDQHCYHMVQQLGFMLCSRAAYPGELLPQNNVLPQHHNTTMPLVHFYQAIRSGNQDKVTLK